MAMRAVLPSRAYSTCACAAPRLNTPLHTVLGPLLCIAPAELQAAHSCLCSIPKCAKVLLTPLGQLVLADRHVARPEQLGCQACGQAGGSHVRRAAEGQGGFRTEHSPFSHSTAPSAPPLWHRAHIALVLAMRSCSLPSHMHDKLSIGHGCQKAFTGTSSFIHVRYGQNRVQGVRDTQTQAAALFILPLPCLRVGTAPVCVALQLQQYRLQAPLDARAVLAQRRRF